MIPSLLSAARSNLQEIVCQPKINISLYLTDILPLPHFGECIVQLFWTVPVQSILIKFTIALSLCGTQTLDSML